MQRIKVIEGVFSSDEKQRMIEKVTEAMVSVEGENLREKTVAILEEVKSSDWGIGGKTHRCTSRVLGYYRRGKGMLLYRVCWEERQAVESNRKCSSLHSKGRD